MLSLGDDGDLITGWAPLASKRYDSTSSGDPQNLLRWDLLYTPMPTRWYCLAHLEATIPSLTPSERRRTDWHSYGMLSTKERGQLSKRTVVYSRTTGECDDKLAVNGQFHFGLLKTAVGGTRRLEIGK